MKCLFEKLTLFLAKKLIVRNRKFRLKLLSLFSEYFRNEYREDTPVSHIYFSCGEMMEVSLSNINFKLNNITLNQLQNGLDNELLMIIKNDPKRIVE